MTDLPTYGLVFDAYGDSDNVSNIGVVDVKNYRPDIDGWCTLEDKNGVKAYFGDYELATFVQRLIDPTRWRFLNDDDRRLLHAALAGGVLED